MYLFLKYPIFTVVSKCLALTESLLCWKWRYAGTIQLELVVLKLYLPKTVFSEQRLLWFKLVQGKMHTYIFLKDVKKLFSVSSQRNRYFICPHTSK